MSGNGLRTNMSKREETLCRRTAFAVGRFLKAVKA
jgi:hypothetical protein